MDSLPIFAVDLVEELDKNYPEQSPNPSDTERELWMKAGERRLVRVLVQKAKQIKDNNLLETH